MFEEEEYTFNGDEVTSMGRNEIDLYTREEWLAYNKNIFETQRII